MPPAIPDKIPCESVGNFEQEIVILREALSYEETEETWDRIARALTRFGAIVKGGGYKFERELVNAVKACSKPIISAMISERTRLSAAALDCISVIAPRIGLAFEPLVSLLIPHILRLASRPNKVYVTRSQNAIVLILGYCHIPAITPHLVTACKESKIATGRAVALEGLLRCLNKWDWAQRDIKARVGDVEEIIRLTGRDKDAGIRQTSRKVFEAYKILFPERIEEFVGPLTPVMKKYLDIKPLPKGQRPAEQVHHHSAAERPRKLPAGPKLVPSTSGARSPLGAHVRNASSNAVGSSSAGNSNSNANHLGDDAIDSRSMGPPATIPIHGRTTHSRSQSHAVMEESVPLERQRVVSAASSTYSIKSAPPASGAGRQPRPTATSPPRPSGAKPLVVGTRGQARRVLKIAPMEPHAANRPDPSTSHKAPGRLMHPQGVNAPGILKNNKGPATGVAFPTMPLERKGAQRVPKPVPPTPAPAPATPPKVQRPATATGVPSKREVKPSIFRRGVAGAPGAGPKEIEKKQEGFVPRRGGGVTQPTISQLSKQRAPASASASHAPKVRVPTGSGRPAWGSSRAGATRGLPASRGQGRGGIPRARTPKLAGKSDVKPAMVPLPASPGRETEVVPQLVPLPASPKTAKLDNDETDEVPRLEARTAEEASEEKTVEQASVERTVEEAAVERTVEDAPPEVVTKPSEVLEETVHEEAVIAEIVDTQPTAEKEEVDMRPEESSDVVQDTASSHSAEVSVAQIPSVPQTPPFPSTDEESEADELEHIEFTTRDVYGPGGVRLKALENKVAQDGNAMPDRSPLGEVVLNA